MRETIDFTVEIREVPLPPETEITSSESRDFASAQGTIQRASGTPLAPSYVNFYVINGAVLVPTFNCSTDQAAIEVIQSAFPKHRVIPYASREFLLGGGGIHCLAKEIPDLSQSIHAKE